MRWNYHGLFLLCAYTNVVHSNWNALTVFALCLMQLLSPPLGSLLWPSVWVRCSLCLHLYASLLGHLYCWSLFISSIWLWTPQGHESFWTCTERWLIQVSGVIRRWQAFPLLESPNGLIHIKSIALRVGCWDWEIIAGIGQPGLKEQKVYHKELRSQLKLFHRDKGLLMVWHRAIGALQPMGRAHYAASKVYMVRILELDLWGGD